MRINYERLVHHIFHHHISIIVIATLLSVFSGYYAAQLGKNIKTDFADLLPDTYISVHELNRIKARVGGIAPGMVIVTSEDLQKAVDFMLVLADELEKNPLISSVSRGKDFDFYDRNRLLYMKLEDLQEIHTRLDDHIELQKFKQSPLYVELDDEEEEELDFSDIEANYSKLQTTGLGRNYYLTKEGNGVILRLYPAGVITDANYSEALLESIEKIIVALEPKRFHPSIEYTFKGSFKNSATQSKIVKEDLKSTALYGALGVLIFIVLYFRHLLAPIFVAVPLLMSLSWTFGVTYLVIGNLNQITVGLFAILFGLGIDFGIHIFARYREAKRRGMDVESALSETVCHTGSALTTTAITTAVAFYSLLATDFKGFSEFGFIVGTGILFSLVAMLCICPALITAAERLSIVRLREDNVPPHLLRHGKYPMPYLTLALGLLATVYSFYHVASGDVEFEDDFHNLKPKLAPTKGSLPAALKEDRSPAIILAETPEEAHEIVATVEKIKQDKLARSDSTTIHSVKSVYSALPKNQSGKLEVIGAMKALIEDSENLFSEDQKVRIDSLRQYLEVRSLTLHDLPNSVTNQFTGKNGEILNFVAINASVQLRHGKNAMAFAREIGTVKTPSGKEYHSSSAHIIFAEMLQIMLTDGVLAVILTLSAIVIVLLIDLRNITDTLLVLTPLLTALIWVTGFMYVFSIKLNLYNMVAFPTIIGMGIDNGVHVFHRYREMGKGSMRLVLRTTGMALVATSLTTMVGFSGLVPAHHPALSSIGILSLIGLGCCFVTAVTLLPALLQVRENRRGDSPQ